MQDEYPKFKAASAQISPVFLDRKATVEKACEWMKRASKNGAKLIAFPETYVPGYPYWIWLDIPTANYPFFRKLFEEAVVIPSQATEELCTGAREADIYVVIGINEKLPTQVGTIWNTNLIIDNKGKIIGKHRKIVPTFAEKMVWSRGDGSMLKVWETDIGRLGTLACGNNFHSLYRYALIAQGEQVHVGNYPAYNPSDQVDHPLWNRVRTAYHSIEGTLFNLCSTSTINDRMIEILCGDDQKKREWMQACHAYSCITNPVGATLNELLDKEDIVYADIDISEMITAKQHFDTIGHYTRMDVVSLNLCKDEDQPILYTSRQGGTNPSVSGKTETSEQIRELRESQNKLSEELKHLRELMHQSEGKSKEK